MRRRSLRTAVLGIVIAGLAFVAPAVHADSSCQDLGGQGTLCTNGDPAAGNFGARLRAGLVNICIVVNQACP